MFQGLRVSLAVYQFSENKCSVVLMFANDTRLCALSDWTGNSNLSAYQPALTMLRPFRGLLLLGKQLMHLLAHTGSVSWSSIASLRRCVEDGLLQPPRPSITYP